SAFAGSNATSDRPPAFPFSLWQPTQYCLTISGPGEGTGASALWATAAGGRAVVGGWGRFVVPRCAPSAAPRATTPAAAITNRFIQEIIGPLRAPTALFSALCGERMCVDVCECHSPETPSRFSSLARRPHVTERP